MKTPVRYLFSVLLMLLSTTLTAETTYTLSKIGYNQGLSNSAVLSLFRDYKGFMWFGTYDGLNRYDGKEMKVIRTSNEGTNSLLNNTIYHVDAANPGCLWISTSTGINRYSIIEDKVLESYQIYNDEYHLYANNQGITWLFNRKNLFYYDYEKSKFQMVDLPEQFFNFELPFVDHQGALWLFSSDAPETFRYTLDTTNATKPKTVMSKIPFHKKRIIYTSYQHGILGFVDEDKDLFLVDLERNTKIYIRNIGGLMSRYGTINGIVSFHGDIILSFIQNGLIKLNGSNHYEASIIDRSLRIFSIYKDPKQDIVWVATDGKGVMSYSQKNTLANQLMFNDIQDKIARPVRSIYTDKQGNLWFGTKGDGLIKIPNYEKEPSFEQDLSEAYVYFPGSNSPIAEYDRGILEYQVFGIIPSRYHDLFWVGSSDAPALSYYDYKKDCLESLRGDYMGVTKVHRVYEQNDSTLWLTSSGKGLQKLILQDTDGKLTVKHSRHINIMNQNTKVDDFFPMVVEGDSVLWLGSRGMGLVRFSLATEKYTIMQLGPYLKSPINDILSIHQSKDCLYLGTVAGLVSVQFDKLNIGSYKCLDRHKGLINDMIHGVLEDNKGILWLSTNKGLVKYNPKNATFHTYYYNNGLKIGEFSDDAFYRSPYSGQLYFGGIDGLLSLNEKEEDKNAYQPTVQFYDLILGGSPVNINDYYNPTLNALIFEGKQSSLTLTFSALDFINGDNIEYSYRLEGDGNEEWTAFTPDNYAKFNSLPYGEYTLHVRYKEDVLDVTYKSYSIQLHVVRPWYLSAWALILYTIGVSGILIYSFLLARKYYRREKLVKELMKYETEKHNQQKVSIRYHELAVKFSNVYRMCGQLHKDPDLSDDFRKMLDAIHEMILSLSFRSESELRTQLHIDDYLPANTPVYEELDVRNLSDELIHMIIYRGYEDLSSLSINIPSHLKAALPEHMLGYILYFLYIRSLKTKQTMQVEASLESARFVLRVSSSEVLASELLDSCQEEPEEFYDDYSLYLSRWLYTYALRSLHAQIEQNGYDTIITLPLHPLESARVTANEKDKKKVLLLEVKKEMVWLISDLLSDEYDVYSVSTAQEAFSYLKKNSPDLFLADTLIYLNQEYRFLEYVESNKGLLMGTVFIPMLTWNATLLSHKDLSRLVDGFVILPYNILFLKEIIKFSLNRSAKDPEALVELPGQQEFVCENADQANFVKKLMQILNENLDKEDLNTTFIAEQMNISLRQYYRKFKEVSTLTSADFIKKYRIERAARMLIETDLPVQEVIEAVGIQSRSYFYKEFSSRFGCTPKAYQKQMKEGKQVDEKDK